MSDQVEKYDEFGDLSLSAEKGENSNLDEYGVWIKKKPSSDEDITQSELQSGDEGSDSNSGEEQEIAFDFDGLTESDSSDNLSGSYEDAFEEELKVTDLASDNSSDSSFNNVDMSNFFTDLGNSEESEEVAKKEDEEALKMDLNFDTVDSYMDDEDKNDDVLSDVSLDVSLEDKNSSDDAELDDFLSDLNSSTSQVSSKAEENSGEQLNGESIDLNIDIDENQDFSNIGQTTDAEESVILPSLATDSDTTPIKEKKEETVVIKNTVVEPENIEEIREENRKVMGNGENKKEMNGFSDIEALANELTSDISAVTTNFSHKGEGTISVEGLDKITDLLTEIVKELSSMKNEISILKTASYTTDRLTNSKKKDEDAEEATGFFKDEDTDEAIALTGDELNNILITADFTEENEPNVKLEEENTEEDADICEPCVEEESEKAEDDFSQEKEVDFDDITLENSKLDDFVIPEELDYSMLNNEGDDTSSNEVASTEGSDMSYLDEKDTEDDVSIEIPETQDISIDEAKNKEASSNTDSEEALPSNLKKEVKSVLAYMDQLLESLPEDKMKEFAESEYFEMYNRLFSELGIS